MTAAEKKTIKWTNKHRREGWLAYLRIGAALPPDEFSCSPRERTLVAHAPPPSESSFRSDLKAAGIDAARIDREVALVDALATADNATCVAIAAERVRHERALRKLTSGRYVAETRERWDVVEKDGSRVEIRGADMIAMSRDTRKDPELRRRMDPLFRVRITHIRRTAR